MKKNNLVLILFFVSNILFAQAEKDSLLKQDINIIVEELEFMYGYDQTMRKYTDYKTFDTQKIDSIEHLPDSLRTVTMKNIKFSNDTLSKMIFRNYINPKDAEHTERLIEITKKYGFPSLDRIKKYYKQNFKDPDFHANLIFIHSPKRYWEELKVLMKNEYKNGNINQCIYGYLLWHFNGRESLQPMLENGWGLVEENGKRILKAMCK